MTQCEHVLYLLSLIDSLKVNDRALLLSEDLLNLELLHLEVSLVVELLWGYDLLTEEQLPSRLLLLLECSREEAHLGFRWELRCHQDLLRCLRHIGSWLCHVYWS